MIEWLLATLFGAWLGAASPQPAAAAASGAPAKLAPAGSSELDRIAFAVEGAESRHGRDLLMWQPNLRGPQGPMQVTEAAALDIGGANRFDATENRRAGRAYLAGLYRRYGNWGDAVAAYNWGPGNLDRWIAAGRPVGRVSASIHGYIERIMREFRSVQAAGAEPPAPLTIAPLTIAPAAAPPAPEIKDPVLRIAFERNAAAIKEIGGFLDGDGSAEGTVLAAMRSISGRPGYVEFKSLHPAGSRPPSVAALPDIARVLLGKLQSENAAILLVDERRRGKRR
jgi:hypothetical protein